jgi:hypothetical protein
MMLRALIITAFALTLSACATVQKLPAAGDVHALLISIRDEDEVTFDSLVDRKALKKEIQARLMAEAGRRNDQRISAVAALLGPTLADSPARPSSSPGSSRRWPSTMATRRPPRSPTCW